VRIPIAVDRHAVQSDVVSREKLNDIVKKYAWRVGKGFSTIPAQRLVRRDSEIVDYEGLPGGQEHLRIRRERGLDLVAIVGCTVPFAP
jgi:hypothetical protein